MRTMNITADTDIQTGTRLFALLTCGQDKVCSQHRVNTVTGVMFKRTCPQPVLLYS